MLSTNEPILQVATSDEIYAGLHGLAPNAGCVSVEPAPDIYASVRSAYRRLGDWDVRAQNFPGTPLEGYGPTLTISASVKTDGTLNNFSMQLPLEVGLALADVLIELRSKLVDS